MTRHYFNNNFGHNRHTTGKRKKAATNRGLDFTKVKNYFTSVLQNFSMRSKPFSMFAMPVA